MRCVVLGSTGFMGRHLVAALQAAGHDVTVFDRREPPEALPGVRIITGDLRDKALVSDAMAGSDVVFHLSWAGYPATRAALAHSINANILPTLALLETCEREGVQRLIFASSGGTVYGVPQYTPIDEAHPTWPINAHGVEKLMVEHYLRLFRQQGRLASVILRFGNVYGPGQEPDRGQGVIATALGRIACGVPVEVWGDGSAVRDYVYIGDAIRAFMLAASADPQDATFNIGTGQGYTITDILYEMQTITAQPVTTKFIPAQPDAVPVNVLDAGRAEAQLGWQANVSLAQGLAATWQWIAQFVTASSNTSKE